MILHSIASVVILNISKNRYNGNLTWVLFRILRQYLNCFKYWLFTFIVLELSRINQRRRDRSKKQAGEKVSYSNFQSGHHILSFAVI